MIKMDDILQYLKVMISLSEKPVLHCEVFVVMNYDEHQDLAVTVQMDSMPMVSESAKSYFEMELQLQEEKNVIPDHYELMMDVMINDSTKFHHVRLLSLLQHERLDQYMIFH